jgi:5,5'-dehydrodivanillate O-demethylase oxygenase subunit
MLSAEKNARLTQTGADTPGGQLLRRYWQALWPACDFTDDQPKKRIKVMGEDLVVYRGDDGAFGCVTEHCTHRGCSLYYGFLEGSAIRCAYHGWKFERDGRCVEQPFEPKDSTFKDRVRQRAYPVQELGGLLFVYMGPLPAPLLPRWDTLVRKDGTRLIEIRPNLTCNWLQAQENTADTTHTYYLHGHMMAQKGIKWESAAYYYRPIVSYDFSLCEWGITKTLFYGGDNPGEEIRPPLIFPNILRIPEGRNERQHWRVPIDDTSTRIIVMQFQPNETGADEPPQAVVPMQYMPDDKGPDGEYALDNFNSQDRMAWETQGAIYDRTQEHLGVTDVGVVMLRKLLDEQIAIVEAGGEPMGILRDPAKNEIIEFSTHSLNRLEAVGSGAAKTS